MMRFRVIVGDEVYAVEVPAHVLEDGADFFARLDRDMDRGWQMSREYVERPDRMQRCQIVADRLPTSIMNNNGTAATLTAAYIVTRTPGAISADVDTTGETEFPLQGVSIRPAQGKLILFPPFWTHLYRGVTLERGVKYIATTWICFA